MCGVCWEVIDDSRVTGDPEVISGQKSSSGPCLRIQQISVSSWATTEEDVERSLAVILRIAERLKS